MGREVVKAAVDQAFASGDTVAMRSERSPRTIRVGAAICPSSENSSSSIFPALVEDAREHGAKSIPEIVDSAEPVDWHERHDVGVVSGRGERLAKCHDAPVDRLAPLRKAEPYVAAAQLWVRVEA